MFVDHQRGVFEGINGISVCGVVFIVPSAPSRSPQVIAHHVSPQAADQRAKICNDKGHHDVNACMAGDAFVGASGNHQANHDGQSHLQNGKRRLLRIESVDREVVEGSRIQRLSERYNRESRHKAHVHEPTGQPDGRSRIEPEQMHRHT